MSPPPEISVVIPTYNRSDSLAVTLGGLARQTVGPEMFEVVVVSDGSTDGTDRLLRTAAADAPYRLRPLRQDNAGPARARNRGIEAAQGSLILFLDDDVEPDPRLLESHAARHRRAARDLVVIGPLSPDARRRPREPVWIAWEHAMLERQYRNFRSGAWPSAGPNHFYSGNASLRREHLLAVGGFDVSFTRQEDVELAYRLAARRDLGFEFAPEAIGVHRPLRDLASWKRVPHAYGRLDVLRARRGDASWDVVRHGYRARSLPTRRLADLLLLREGPSTRSLDRAEAALGAAAAGAYRLGGRGPAFALLSTLFNLRYLRGAAEEMGGPRPLRALLHDGPDAVAVLKGGQPA